MLRLAGGWWLCHRPNVEGLTQMLHFSSLHTHPFIHLSPCPPTQPTCTTRQVAAQSPASRWSSWLRNSRVTTRQCQGTMLNLFSSSTWSAAHIDGVWREGGSRPASFLPSPGSRDCTSGCMATVTCCGGRQGHTTDPMRPAHLLDQPPRAPARKAEMGCATPSFSSLLHARGRGEMGVFWM